MITQSPVTQSVKQVLQHLYGERLARLVLFGSYARGDQREDSDMDFLVVLKDNYIQTGREIRYMNTRLFDLELQYGLSISAHPTTVQQFADSDFLFYQNVRKEGIEL